MILHRAVPPGTWAGFAVLLPLTVAGCGLFSPDGGPFAVEAVVPVDGATGVSIHAAPSALFSDVAALPPDADAFTLERDGVSVPGTVERRGDTLALVPTLPLEFATTYQASLTSAITDTAGQALGQTYTWTFTTLGAPPPALSEASLLQHVGVLAHDSLRGRGSASVDEYRAATYLRAQFQAFGLDAGVPEYMQPFEPGAGQTSQNVLAVLPGEGALANQWIVVGAHYDHVGLDASLQIRNGADDNASGTALVLELARALHGYVASGGTGGEPRRSFLFVAFGAEEMGLLGSHYYCSHPIVQAAYVTAMLNFDMVGRLRGDSLSVIGLWTSPEWNALLARYAPAQLALIDKRDCQSCSDHACFVRAGRPAVWFFTGFHPQYHRPDDDAELINGPGLAEIGTLGMRTLIHLAVRPNGLADGTGTPPTPGF